MKFLSFQSPLQHHGGRSPLVHQVANIIGVFFFICCWILCESATIWSIYITFFSVFIQCFCKTKHCFLYFFRERTGKKNNGLSCQISGLPCSMEIECQQLGSEWTQTHIRYIQNWYVAVVYIISLSLCLFLSVFLFCMHQLISQFCFLFFYSTRRIMISRSWGASNISLYPNYKIVGGLNPPIASFQIRVLDNIGKQSRILAMSGD